MNPLLQRDFTRLLDKRLNKVYVDKFKELKLIIDQLFNVVNDKSAWSEYYSVGDIGDPERFNGTIQYQGITGGYHTKIEPVEYAGGITVQRLLLETEQYGVINGRVKGLAKAANRKMNKIAHEPFRYADSSAFTFMQSEEGVALCSDSHTTKSPNVSTSVGFDNYQTLVFDPVNLEAMRLAGLSLRSDIGERYETHFDTIIHPSSLAEDVYEITKTHAGLNTEHGNVNFQEGKWKAIELPMLDDWDTANWFVVDSELMKECLIWQIGTPLEFMNTTDFDTMMRKYADYFRIGWGFTDWRWIMGSFPA
jgi:hypothetical protein